MTRRLRQPCPVRDSGQVRLASCSTAVIEMQLAMGCCIVKSPAWLHGAAFALGWAACASRPACSECRAGGHHPLRGLTRLVGLIWDGEFVSSTQRLQQATIVCKHKFYQPKFMYHVCSSSEGACSGFYNLCMAKLGLKGSSLWHVLAMFIKGMWLALGGVGGLPVLAPALPSPLPTAGLGCLCLQACLQ